MATNQWAAREADKARRAEQKRIRSALVKAEKEARKERKEAIIAARERCAANVAAARAAADEAYRKAHAADLEARRQAKLAARQACASDRSRVRTEAQRKLEDLRARKAQLDQEARIRRAEVASQKERDRETRKRGGSASDRLSERIQQEAQNLPAKYRKDFAAMWRKGLIKGQRGQAIPDGAKWERFLEIVAESSEGPEVIDERKLARQLAREQAQRARSAGRTPRRALPPAPF